MERGREGEREINAWREFNNFLITRTRTHLISIIFSDCKTDSHAII